MLFNLSTYSISLLSWNFVYNYNCLITDYFFITYNSNSSFSPCISSISLNDLSYFSSIPTNSCILRIFSAYWDCNFPNDFDKVDNLDNACWRRECKEWFMLYNYEIVFLSGLICLCNCCYCCYCVIVLYYLSLNRVYSCSCNYYTCDASFYNLFICLSFSPINKSFYLIFKLHPSTSISFSLTLSPISLTIL